MTDEAELQQLDLPFSAPEPRAEPPTPPAPAALKETAEAGPEPEFVAPPALPAVDLDDRCMGALLGLACGDALGAPIEFMSQEAARARHGLVTEMVGGGAWAPGEWTDDTAMALCIAEAILEKPADPVAGAGKRFLAWAKTAKDVGGTISAALRGYRSCGDWAEASSTTSQARNGRAGGNGSLMRTLPVALAYPDIRTMLVTSARLSAMTHWDSQAEVCCALYNLWITRLLAGATLADSWPAALVEAREWASKGSLAPATPGPSRYHPSSGSASSGCRRRATRTCSRRVSPATASSVWKLPPGVVLKQRALSRPW